VLGLSSRYKLFKRSHTVHKKEGEKDRERERKADREKDREREKGREREKQKERKTDNISISIYLYNKKTSLLLLHFSTFDLSLKTK
jgi:hypothetical protein